MVISDKIKKNLRSSEFFPILKSIYGVLLKIKKIIDIPKLNYSYYKSKRIDNYKGLVNHIKNLPDFPKLTFFDIGARGDIPQNFRSYRDLLTIVGFEADEIECERLNKEANSNEIFYPYVIGNGQEETLRFAAHEGSTGITETNQLFLERFNYSFRENLKVLKKTKVKTIKINDLINNKKIPMPDFIKLDLEGYEAEVLENSTACFDNSFLGLYSEIIFGPLKNPNNFVRIDILCRENNLHLFDIRLDNKFARKSFPKRYKFWNNLVVDFEEEYGQRISADLLYLRDPINDYQNNIDFNWSDFNILKLLLIYESYNLNDCAIELLEFYKGHFETKLPINKLKNLLVPKKFNPFCLSYDEYNLSIKNFKGLEKVYEKLRKNKR